MKISLVSDLHLEFGYQSLNGGEVLILAGDIAEARSIAKHHHSTKVVSDKPDEHYRCSEFFYHECAKYDRVFYVMGNHEHYHGRFDQTYEQLKAIMPANVTLLENEVVEYKGIMFMGATLWTDLNKEDPITGWTLKSGMNDYRLVTNGYPAGNTYGKLTPGHTKDVHMATRNYFRGILANHTELPFVIITHHGPSPASINEKYRHDYHMNGGYVSDLSDLILDNPQIKFWVHGHLHDPVDYMIGSTRILSNPRGYIGHEDTSQFRKDLAFEIDT